MDNLVLTSASAALEADLRGGFLAAVVEEPPHRFRLRFEKEEWTTSVVISLFPALPWIGRPMPRRGASHSEAGPFSRSSARLLGGRPVLGVEKPPPERAITIVFTDGWRLVAEVMTHAGNLFVLDPEGRITASGRRGRGGRRRLEIGARYEPPRPPAGGRSPFGAAADELDRFIRDERAAGCDDETIVGRRLWGVGDVGGGLAIEEARSSGRSLGDVLVHRLAAVVAGEARPVIEGPEDFLSALDADRLDPSSFRLLPWTFRDPASGRIRSEGRDPAATAGLYHAALEAALSLRRGAEALRAILHEEIQRVLDAAERARRDFEGFADPERHRLYGEALLAGLTAAERRGDRVVVPDPRAEDGRVVAVPCPPGLPPVACAEDHFQKYRRAVRGRERARLRVESLEGRAERLRGLLDTFASARTSVETASFEAGMRSAGIPVGLESKPSRRAARSVAPAPRLEGVRLLTSRDGLEILVGRSGLANDRLTFKIASPEDFWFHAKGVPGAHVVVRNPTRSARPPRATLEEAASLAAWFSEARGETAADVQWTRRKYVRRIRGAGRGTVTLKRFETVRVRPASPAGSEESERR